MESLEKKKATNKKYKQLTKANVTKEKTKTNIQTTDTRRNRNNLINGRGCFRRFDSHREIPKAMVQMLAMLKSSWRVLAIHYTHFSIFLCVQKIF